MQPEIPGDSIGDLEEDIDVLLGQSTHDDIRGEAASLRNRLVAVGTPDETLDLEETVGFRAAIMELAEAAEAHLCDDIAARMQQRPLANGELPWDSTVD